MLNYQFDSDIQLQSPLVINYMRLSKLNKNWWRLAKNEKQGSILNNTQHIQMVRCNPEGELQ